jgi:hypothetical protein
MDTNYLVDCNSLGTEGIFLAVLYPTISPSISLVYIFTGYPISKGIGYFNTSKVVYPKGYCWIMLNGIYSAVAA